MKSSLISEEQIIRLANSVGFELCGFTRAAELPEEKEKLQKWIAMGYHAGMTYMERNFDKKGNPSLVMEDTVSVISLGMIYNTDYGYTGDSDCGKISRYAWGDDYHFVMWDALEKLCTWITEREPEFKSIYYVDTGPVMDKVWAVRSGIGWMGKHTNIINKESGSWFFIANIFTDLELKPSKQIEDFCGDCTACIDACPTNAIAEPYLVDANKCISYLTIENKGNIKTELAENFDGWLFGCDICQDVCPWNIKFGAETDKAEFMPRNNQTAIPLQQIESMEQSDFKYRFTGSPILRAKLKGLKRNAEAVKISVINRK